MKNEELKKEGNILKFTGDIDTLPKCAKCSGKEKSNHDFLTYEHPYKMDEEEEEE